MDVTLLTCTPDQTTDLFRRHLASVKDSACSCEHLVFDNRWSGDFNHSREINRAARIARGRFLVTMDDDVIVRGRWLEALLDAHARSGAAVVGGIHRWEDERINHTGGWVMWDGRGNHFDDPIESDGCFPYVCSAICLIDLEQIGQWGVSFDEGFRKYFQEVDFCMNVWEHGGLVLSTPACDVYHLVGQAMKSRPDHKAVDQADKQRFIDRWMATGRFEDVMREKQAMLRWGGLDQIRAYDTYLRQFEQALDTGLLDDLLSARAAIRPFLCVGHAKHVARVLDERIAGCRANAA
jgi:GT2 family glycosyltransferase